jgi:hypothetical protein
MSLQKISLEPFVNYQKIIKMNNYFITNTFATDKYLYVSYINDKGYDNPNGNNMLVQYDIKTEKKNWDYKYKSRLPTALFSTRKYFFMSVVNKLDTTNNSNEILKLNIKDGKLQEKLNTIELVLSIFIENDKLYTASSKAIKIYNLNNKLDEPIENILLNKDIKLKVEQNSYEMNLIIDNNFMYLSYQISQVNSRMPDKFGLCKINKYNKKVIWIKRSQRGTDLSEHDIDNLSVLYISNDFIYTNSFNKDLEYPEDFSSYAIKLDKEKGRIKKIYKYTDENRNSEYGDVNSGVTSICVKFGYVFVGATDGIIRIFNEKTGKLLTRLYQYSENDEVTDIIDIYIINKYLYTSSDLYVKKWDLNKIPFFKKLYNIERKTIKNLNSSKSLPKLPQEIKNIIAKKTVFNNNIKIKNTNIRNVKNISKNINNTKNNNNQSNRSRVSPNRSSVSSRY